MARIIRKVVDIQATSDSIWRCLLASSNQPESDWNRLFTWRDDSSFLSGQGLTLTWGRAAAQDWKGVCVHTTVESELRWKAGPKTKDSFRPEVDGLFAIAEMSSGARRVTLRLAFSGLRYRMLWFRMRAGLESALAESMHNLKLQAEGVTSRPLHSSKASDETLSRVDQTELDAIASPPEPTRATAEIAVGREARMQSESHRLMIEKAIAQQRAAA